MDTTGAIGMANGKGSSNSTPIASPPLESDPNQSVASTSSVPMEDAMKVTHESIAAEQIKDKPPSPSLNPNLPVCANCRTQTTPLWRRADNGTTLCNACSLYLKMKGHPRPVSLKTDIIKHRNRSKGESAKKANKAAMVAAATMSASTQVGEDLSRSARYRSTSRGGSHSRTRELLGQKSGPGGSIEDEEGEEWDGEPAGYKRARHGVAYAYAAPQSRSETSRARGTSRGGSRSSSNHRRSDSSESRSREQCSPPPPQSVPPHLVPYPVFWYPPQAGHSQAMPPYPFAYPAPPPEWAAWMQQVQASMAAMGGRDFPQMPPPPVPSSGLPLHVAQSLNGGPYTSTIRSDPSVGLPPADNYDGVGRESERGRSPRVPPPAQAQSSSHPLQSAAGSTPDGMLRAAFGHSSYYHPYHRSASQHARASVAVSDTRFTPPLAPRDSVNSRTTDPVHRPTSSASSSGGSGEGRALLNNSPGLLPRSKVPDAMTIDEVDESPAGENGGPQSHPNPAHGPVRVGPAYERRGRSSTRKPAAGIPNEVNERMGRMRVELSLSPKLSTSQLPAVSSLITAAVPPGATFSASSGALSRLAADNTGTIRTGVSEGSADEITALRLRVAELEFINGILQTRLSDIERSAIDNAGVVPRLPTQTSSVETA